MCNARSFWLLRGCHSSTADNARPTARCNSWLQCPHTRVAKVQCKLSTCVMSCLRWRIDSAIRSFLGFWQGFFFLFKKRASFSPALWTANHSQGCQLSGCFSCCFFLLFLKLFFLSTTCMFYNLLSYTKALLCSTFVQISFAEIMYPHHSCGKSRCWLDVMIIAKGVPKAAPNKRLL